MKGWMLAQAAAVAVGVAGCRDRPAGGPAPASPPPAAREESTMKTNGTPKVFASELAGSWYTRDPAELDRELRGYLADVQTPPATHVCALIMPHAGYTYSGRVAAHAARQVQGRSFRRVVVMGPSHRVAMPNTVALADATHYRTILGTLPVDTEFVGRLARYPLFRTMSRAQPGEHSIEMEFPLLQVALGEFTLVPLVVGQLDDHAIHEAAAALRAEVDPETLVVASTDFTHYGPRFDYVPFSDDIPAALRRLDLGAFDFVQKKDLRGFRHYLDQTGATICGRDPVSILLGMLPAEAEVKLLEYDTSGRLTGDWENSVSYVAAAIAGRWDGKKDPAARARQPGDSEDVADDAPLPIPAEDRRALLGLVRRTIEFYFAHRRKPTIKELDFKVTPAMRQEAGAFVTLHKAGDLRGCIGEIFPERALIEAVMDHALNSAFRDPRFSPLRKDELPEVDVEISALAPPSPVSSWKDIVIGRHGIVLSKGARRSVFLPQVAPEQGWDVETTLAHLSMKAGLPADAWREGAAFEVFEAVVFGEKERR